MSPWSCWERFCLWVIALGCLACISHELSADQVYLKNGVVLKGTVVAVSGINVATAQQNNVGPIPSAPFYLIDDGVRRYFVFRRQTLEVVDEDELAGLVSYKLDHERTPRTHGPSVVGAFGSVEPFDQYGRRTVTLQTASGLTPVIQAITELRPDYAEVEGLSHLWEYRIDTSSLPTQTIRDLMRQTSDPQDPKEARAAVQFFLQAEMYSESEAELTRTRESFPELRDWCGEIERQVFEQKARQALHEIERRRDSGQHQLAYLIAKKFPEDRVSAGVMRQAREIAEDYESALADKERAEMMLDLLQAEIPIDEAQRLRPLRQKLTAELHFETVGRLMAFLQTDGDDGLSARQKLALAYSGWLVGPDQAFLDLDEAMKLWEARFLVLEYLRTDRNPARDQEILEQLESVESLSVTRLAEMIARLPMPYEQPSVQPAEIQTHSVAVRSDRPDVTYSVMLPPEYREHHRYPLLVVLNRGGQTEENAIRWWAGDAAQPGWAQRRGYVVLAPHFASDHGAGYLGTDIEHDAVLLAIRHLRQRVRIDSDRIFLVGHGMGADACFDIAMSHPDLFAGAVPIAGMCDKSSKWYWGNAPKTSWYIVAGQLDRNTLEQNASVINNMMRDRPYGQDVIYCEYQNRGFESFHEEQERIFSWMQGLKRAPIQEYQSFEAASLRKTDNAFYWLEAHALADRFFQPIAWDISQKRSTVKFSGDIKPGRIIYVNHPGERTVLHLHPDLVDFGQRWRIKVNSRQQFNDILAPSLESMLWTLRETGDRERLVWLRLEL
ncbi:MAG: hypothetical protein KDA80_08370 [Planctomycetaceae bacterium]|nr:hypothetical protein [Planctomycetaceae bacterium]